MSKSFMKQAVDKTECHFCKEQVEDFWKHHASCRIRLSVIKELFKDKLPF